MNAHVKVAELLAERPVPKVVRDEPGDVTRLVEIRAAFVKFYNEWCPMPDEALNALMKADRKLK